MISALFSPRRESTLIAASFPRDSEGLHGHKQKLMRLTQEARVCFHEITIQVGAVRIEWWIEWLAV